MMSYSCGEVCLRMKLPNETVRHSIPRFRKRLHAYAQQRALKTTAELFMAAL